jgi:methylated-DNA-[protein]-cysteine S-methyltransferase
MTIPAELDQRFRDAADRAGLVDVAYDLAESPVGDLLVAVTERGLCRIAYRPDEAVDELAVDFGVRVLRIPRRVDRIRRELDEYFAGRRREFNLPLDWSLIQGFTRMVLDRTARIPYGKVATYGEVARDIGKPRASRAAGNALGANPIPIVVPCHRVIRSGGVLGNYGGGPERKVQLLELEGAG